MNLAIHCYPIENLAEYERNRRKNDDVVNKMFASIRKFSFRISIVAKSDTTVVDGHLRLKAARKLGTESISVILSDNLNEPRTKAFRLRSRDLAKVQISTIFDYSLN